MHMSFERKIDDLTKEEYVFYITDYGTFPAFILSEYSLFVRQTKRHHYRVTKYWRRHGRGGVPDTNFVPGETLPLSFGQIKEMFLKEFCERVTFKFDVAVKEGI